MILLNGRITTLEPGAGEARALAIRDGRFWRSAATDEVMRARPGPTVIDLRAAHASSPA